MRKAYCLAVIFILCVYNIGQAAVIIEEDFETFPSAWDCNSSSTGVNDWYLHGRTPQCPTPPGISRGFMQIGAGRTGQALHIYLWSGLTNDYNQLYLWPSWPSNTKEIYNRFSIKIDPSLDKNISPEVKWWRFFNAAGAVFYTQTYGNTFRTGQWVLDVETEASRLTFNAPMSLVNDGEWHTVEWHFKLETSNGAGDGYAGLYIDGVLKGSHDDITWFGATASTFADHIRVGMGNFGDADWQATPAAVVIDDYVLSTTYNGVPGGEESPEDTTNPAVAITSPTTNTSYDNGETATISLSGTASDNVGVTSVAWNNSRGGSGTATGTTSWTQGGIELYSGSNIITVTARDAAGNTASDTITVTYTPGTTEPLLIEPFTNTSYESRGWYDNTTLGTLETSGCYSGNCMEWAWAQGGATPTNGDAARHKFTATDRLYIKFRIKLDENWRGSQTGIPPHMIHLLSNLDDDWGGTFRNYANVYVEFEDIVGSPYNTRPQIMLQDSLRIMPCPGASYPCDLTSTEYRSVAGCNGTSGGSGTPDCFSYSGLYYNYREWDADAYVTKGEWLLYEAYFQMNTISNGESQGDGKLWVKINGNYTINKSDVEYRTAQDSTKKFAQIVLAPYMGDGSPIAQSVWIDELEIYNAEEGVFVPDPTIHGVTLQGVSQITVTP